MVACGHKVPLKETVIYFGTYLMRDRCRTYMGVGWGGRKESQLNLGWPNRRLGWHWNRESYRELVKKSRRKGAV